MGRLWAFTSVATRRRPTCEMKHGSRLRAFTSVGTLRRSKDACTLHRCPLGLHQLYTGKGAFTSVGTPRPAS